MKSTHLVNYFPEIVLFSHFFKSEHMQAIAFYCVGDGVVFVLALLLLLFAAIFYTSAIETY